MQIQGYTTFETYRAGQAMICQPMNGSKIEVNSELFIPSEELSSAPVMPQVAIGDTVVLHIPCGALTIRVTSVRCDPSTWAPEEESQFIEGEGSWDGAYNALIQGASGVGEFSVRLYDTTQVHTSAWDEPVPLCVYQAARLAACNARDRAFQMTPPREDIDWPSPGHGMDTFIHEALDILVPMTVRRGW